MFLEHLRGASEGDDDSPSEEIQPLLFQIKVNCSFSLSFGLGVWIFIVMYADNKCYVEVDEKLGRSVPNCQCKTNIVDKIGLLELYPSFNRSIQNIQSYGILDAYFYMLYTNWLTHNF